MVVNKWNMNHVRNISHFVWQGNLDMFLTVSSSSAVPWAFDYELRSICSRSAASPESLMLPQMPVIRFRWFDCDANLIWLDLVDGQKGHRNEFVRAGCRWAGCGMAWNETWKIMHKIFQLSCYHTSETLRLECVTRWWAENERETSRRKKRKTFAYSSVV